MKKIISLLLCLLLVFGLAACSSSKQEEFNWTREGTFQDENGNYLMIYLSEDIDHPGWSVGLYTEEEMLGWFLMPGEGNTLHGNLVPDYEEGEFIVITDCGFYKRVISGEIEPMARYRKGIKIVELGKEAKVVYAGYVKEPFDIAVIDDFGVIFSVNTEDLSIEARTTKGKTLKTENKKRHPAAAYKI